jgi:hypothetical protein
MPGGGARIVRLRSMWGRRVRTGAVGVATIVAVLVLTAACESSDDVRIRDVDGKPTWRLLSLGINTCNADLSAEVEETAEEVRIRVHAENTTGDSGDCRDLLRVTLDDALGNRRVIDDRTGEELRVVYPQADPGVAGIGDPVRDGDFTFTVTAVGGKGPPFLGGQPSFLEPQVKLVFVYVTVRNDGSSPGSFAEDYQYLTDGDGRKSEGYLDRGDLSLAADINPGDTVEGVLVFDIASDTVPAWIELHASRFSGGVTVLLG